MFQHIGAPNVDAVTEQTPSYGDSVGVLGAIGRDALHQRLGRPAGADMAGGDAHQCDRFLEHPDRQFLRRRDMGNRPDLLEVHADEPIQSECVELAALEADLESPELG